MTTYLNQLYMYSHHRKKAGSTIVQGAKNIRLLLTHGIKLAKLGITVPEKWMDPNEIEGPAIDVLHNPEKWPAEEYVLTSINVTRKFMGPSAQPGRHELWAEVPTATPPLAPIAAEAKRILILNHLWSDRDAGEIIRAARGLAFDGGFLCGGGDHKADIFSPTALSASRLQSFFWPVDRAGFPYAVETARELGFTLIYICPLPDAEIPRARVGTMHYWRRDGQTVDREELRGKKIALVVSVNTPRMTDEDICLSIPLTISPTASCQELTSLSTVPA